METTLGYIIIFGLIALFAFFYLRQNEKKTLLLIAGDTYPELQLTIFIQKEKRKITDLVLQLEARKEDLPFGRIEIELSDQEHRKKSIDLTPHLSTDQGQKLRSGEKKNFSLAFSDFLSMLDDSSFDYENFRLTVRTGTGKVFKTHLLTYHPRWGIFKSDSGKYN